MAAKPANPDLSSSREKGVKDTEFRNRILTIEVLIFFLPCLILSYIFYKNIVLINTLQMLIVAFTFLLILSGMLIIRRAFEKFFNMACLIRRTGDTAGSLPPYNNKSGLDFQETAAAFENFTQRFENISLELKQRILELLTIRELIESAGKSLDIEQLLKTLLEKAMAVSAARSGSVLRLDPDKESLKVIRAAGPGKGQGEKSPIHMKESILKTVVMEKRPLRENPGDGAAPSLSLPVLVRGEVLGVLNLSGKGNGRAFDANDEQILGTMIGEIGFALENAVLHSQVREHLQRVRSRTAALAKVNHKLQKESKERRKVEEDLRESEEKYRTILEGIDYGYFELDPNGGLIFFSDNMGGLFDLPQAEVDGLNIRQLLGDKNAGEFGQVLDMVQKTGTPSKLIEITRSGKDGQKQFLEISVFLARNAPGQPQGFRGLLRDITQRKIMESQVLAAQKMEALGTLAGGIAHNFNNLLMGIQGNACLTRLDLKSDTRNSKRLENIEKLVGSGSKLTNQLLGYARKGKYDIKPFNLNRLVMEVADTFAATKKGIRIHLDLAEDLFGIMADYGQIEQVILNLLVNASDAMPHGGDITLNAMNVTHEGLKTRPFTTRPGNYIMLTIRDTGIGMDEKTMEHIFEPFFTTKDYGRGTGLGLASVYGIIKAHDGYIDVESRPGRGSDFSIYLPAYDKDIHELEETDIEIIRGSGTILLVDDEEAVLKSSSMMLKRLGYRVIEASGGVEAIQKLENFKDRIDLIILDIVMPDMGGGSVFDRIREIDPRIKVLIASGYSLDGEASEILKRGGDSFIQKPFNMSEISRKLLDVLESE